jgi:hypothetical protein
MHAYIHKDKGQGDAGRSIAADKDLLRTATPRYIESINATNLTVFKDEYW